MNDDSAARIDHWLSMGLNRIELQKNQTLPGWRVTVTLGEFIAKSAGQIDQAIAEVDAKLNEYVLRGTEENPS